MSSIVNKVGYVYDPKLELHKTDDHPECPERIQAIRQILVSRGLLNQMIGVKTREATFEELKMAHGEQYLKSLEFGLSGSKKDLKNIENIYNSIYVNKHTLSCAKLAAGSTIELATRVARGDLNSGVAIVRPPGHHAGINQADGFCFYNNVGISAKILKSMGYKVLIVDYDIHAGQGTEEIVAGESNILFFSIHRHDHGTFYPAGHEQSKAKNIININLNGNITDETYLDSLNRDLVPVAKAFSPDIILVSAGFDAISGDPLGCSHLTPEGYASMTRLLMSLCPKIVMVLEGGYHLINMSIAFAECVKVLLGGGNSPILLKKV